MSIEKIGIIAGNRKFPLIFAEAAKKRNCYLVAIAVKGDTSNRLRKLVDKIYWLRLSEFSRMFDIFKAEGITKIVMAGQISPHRLFSKEVEKDAQLHNLLSGLKDRKADTIFGAIAERLNQAGFELLDSTLFLDAFLPQKGTLTKREPNPKEWEDIYFGLGLAKKMGELDIGQTVAVKDKAVVAVEALEGTDNLIRRAGKITRFGMTLVKVSKPRQDKRFDIPVVGLRTVKKLIKVNARCLAIEAGKTLFLDKEISLKLADRKGLIIVAV